MIKKLLIITIFATLLIGFSACGNTKLDVLPESVSITLNGKAYDLANDCVLILDELSIEKGITIKNNSKKKLTLNAEYFADAYAPNGVMFNNKGKLNIDSIVNESIIKVSILGRNDETLSAKIVLTPSGMPELETSGQSSSDKDFYFTTNYGTENINYIFKTNNSGKLLYYKQFDQQVYDFQKFTTTDGKIRYSYIEIDTNHFNFNDYGKDSMFVYSKLTILDENYNFVKSVTYDMGDGTDNGIELHDTLYFNDNHWIVCTNVATILRNDDSDNTNDIPDYMVGERKKMFVIGCLLQEVKNGEIIWEFDSRDYPELYGYYSTDLATYSIGYQDYMHFNSMSVANDGNLLVSMRDIDGILKISRTNGELLWILGGDGDEFNLSDKFLKQHSIVQLQGNKVMLYDNGEAGIRESSRLLEITLDETNKTSEIVANYDLGVFSYAMGSVQKISDNTYIYCLGVYANGQAVIEEKNFETNNINFRLVIVGAPHTYNVNYC